MKTLLRLAALGVALLISGAASAQQYPAKPVKIIVPFAAGGPTDVVARLVAHELSVKLGQQFYIENIPGAGATVGIGRVASGPKDGSQILILPIPAWAWTTSSVFAKPSCSAIDGHGDTSSHSPKHMPRRAGWP